MTRGHDSSSYMWYMWPMNLCRDLEKGCVKHIAGFRHQPHMLNVTQCFGQNNQFHDWLLVLLGKNKPIKYVENIDQHVCVLGASSPVAPSWIALVASAMISCPLNLYCSTTFNSSAGLSCGLGLSDDGLRWGWSFDPDFLLLLTFADILCKE